ncbi:MAG: glutathione S-transferase family protein [Rhodospirillaceae bacterium]|jgi:glutathione S-transferase|nr:glutathione S-transferase family protein [Rhodospirillaceae bacterium]MBT6140053.1 glutathione S-transferase family protein [Rhodospirillaceae bacterium]
MLKILGRPNSGNVQKVTWVCGEIGLAFEREDIGGAFGRTKDADYIAMNPNSVVPTIVDDGFVLWESNAITRYLVSKHANGTLAPTDPQAYADADRWMDWQQTTVAPNMLPIFWGLVRTPEAERDLDAIDQARLRGIQVWQILDDRLAGREYIMGDALTMADIPVAIQCYRWTTLIQDRPAMPNLEAWYARCAERPAFKEHVLDIPLT